MATITRTNETAKKAYEHAHAEAMELTSRITGLLNDVPAPDSEDWTIDWGHVGDLNDLNSRLTEILRDRAPMLGIARKKAHDLAEEKHAFLNPSEGPSTEAMELTSRITELLNRAEIRGRFEAIDWGHVGDLTRLAEILGDAVETGQVDTPVS